MTSTTSTAQAHATVLRFLINHGYNETAEVFKREASHYLEPHQLPMLPESLSQDGISPSSSINELTNTRRSRTEDIRQGDDDYYTTQTDSFSDIHSTNILAVAVEPHTNMIATSCVDKTVKINTMFCSDDSILSKGYRHHQAPVLSIDFHPSYPQLMLTTSMDGSSALVDISCEHDEKVEHPQVLQRFHDHERYIIRGIFSSHCYFATASYDHTVIIYKSNLEDTANRLPEYTLLKQFRFTGNVETICFYDDETLIVGVRHDTHLHYIRLADMLVTRINMSHDDGITFSPVWISVSPDGRHLLCTTDHASGLTLLFALGEQQRQVQRYYIHPTENAFTTKRHLWHPSGLYFYALGGDDNAVAVVETRTGRVIHSLTGHQAMIRSMAMSNMGLVTAGYDHTIKIWSRPTLNR